MDNSKTLKALSEFNNIHDKSNSHVYVWNNGPISLDPSCSIYLSKIRENGWDVHYSEDITNRPLSLLYNNFINVADSNRFVILDHDSVLSNSFLQAIYYSNDCYDLILPKIIAKDKYLYPRVNDIVIENDSFLRQEGLMSIGSGICINRSLTEIMKRKFGSVFDENFALYGVDTTFFLRVQNLSCSIKILCKGLLFHSLSRLENEDINTNKMRSLERAYDLGLMLRHYPSVKLVKLFILALCLKVDYPLFPTIISFIKGVHPRCRNNN